FAAVMVLACLYLTPPLAYEVWKFFRFETLQAALLPYTPTANRLFVPTLSPTNTDRIARSVREHVGPDDVVVMATFNLGMEAWLEFPGRMLPLTAFWAPLQRSHGAEGASFVGTSKFFTSRNLRVLLVMSSLYTPTE